MKLLKKGYLFCICFALLVISTSASAQNLVPNFSFETVSGLPTEEDQLNLASPWQSLNNSPDLFYAGQVNIPLLPCDDVDIPFNAGGYCPTRTGGSGYAGIRLDFSFDYREYIAVPLTIPLIAGELYRVEAYFQRSDSSRYACNKLGALFTNNIPLQPGSGTIGFLPSPNLESNLVISDTSAWTLLTGIYQAAGGENYITIGLFRQNSDPALTIVDLGNLNPDCGNFLNSAYYFIDEVTVKPVAETVEIIGDTIICPGETTILSANTNVPFWWSDSNNPTDTLSLNDSIIISPANQTTYYLNGLFVQDSVTVNIVSPPVVNLGPDSVLCEADTVELDGYVIDGIDYLWSSGDTTSLFGVTDSGTYWLQVTNAGCSRRDTISFSGFLPNPELSLGLDSTYCFFIEDTLTLDGGAGISYLWTPTNETTRQIKVMYPATYYVTTTRSNGCPRIASLEVAEVCVPLIFIPSAFTPDGDNLNDVLYPIVNNLVAYNFRILNRWGQTVFYSIDPNEGWDGKYNGADEVPGTYVYRVNFEGLDFEGSKLKGKRFGTITLIR